jgi:uncharacterized repeat protein (TIGR03803 family)
MKRALGKSNWGKRAYAVLMLCAATAIAVPAQTPTTLVIFNGTDGQGVGSDMTLIQGTNGDFYGTTVGGGTGAYFVGCCGGGTVFKITTAGKLTTLYNFCSQPNCADGSGPNARLVQAANGDFYGTTFSGGANYSTAGGTVFKMTPTGKLTTLYSFCSQVNCADGDRPMGGLVQATNGDFYGTTNQGGNANGAGTVFKTTAAGELTTLYRFCSQTNCTDGATPFASLVQATDGNFYGTTFDGGAECASQGVCGTVFKISPTGRLRTLVTVGEHPSCTLVQATDGNFYGTTVTSGTVFKVTPEGTLTTLGVVGGYPWAGLVQATDGNLYGTTYVGGANNNGICEDNGCGSVFSITPEGTLKSLYSFCSQPNCADGYSPLAGLMQATNGNLYGTTVGGGIAVWAPDFNGSVFSLGVGLGPFVEMHPTSGKVGATVRILGNKLLGSTSVSFNGVPAPFVVRSSTLITATVPASAATGTVKVTTPSGMLSSNVSFRVQ